MSQNATVHSATLLDVASLKPHPRNYREHPEDQLEHIERSIAQHGFYRNVVCASDLTVLAGHGVVEAAKRLGMAKVPVIKLACAPDSPQALKVLTGDNQIAQLAHVDNRKLSDLMSELSDIDELIGTGFDDASVAELLELSESNERKQPSEVEQDEVPEPPKNPVTKLGDVWQLGRHVVVCADIRQTNGDAENCKALFTDPPYGVRYKAMRDADLPPIKGDESQEHAEQLMLIAFGMLKPNVAFVCCSWRSMSITSSAMEKSGISPKACIVWDKTCGVQNLDRFHKQHEMLLYHGPYGGQRTVDSDVWQIPRDFSADHPTPKPVELVARALRSCDEKTVFDPFLGSGTTLIAAEQLGRTCHGIEIEPAYVDVVIERWQNLTGGKAVRNGSV